MQATATDMQAKTKMTAQDKTRSGEVQSFIFWQVNVVQGCKINLAAYDVLPPLAPTLE